MADFIAENTTFAYPGKGAITINDSTNGGKLLGSIAELQVQRELINKNFLETSFSAVLTAEKISRIAGLSTAIYRMVKRNVFGTDYDTNTGPSLQQGEGTLTTLQLGKYLTFRFSTEQFDMAVFMSSPTPVKERMLAIWLGSYTKNLIINRELIFKQAVKTWCIASYDPDSKIPSVIVQKRSDLDTKEKVEAFFIRFADIMTDRLQIVNNYIIGTNEEDWKIIFSSKGYNSLLRGFTQFIDKTGAQSLTSGEWYANSVVGYPVYKDITLELAFPKGSDERMNKDVDFDLTGVWGMICHSSDWAFPMSWETFGTTLNPNTLNQQTIGKVLLSLPQSMLGLSCVLMDEEPTADDIAAAKAQCALQTNQVMGPYMADNYRVQLASWDKLAIQKSQPLLSDILKVSDLGELVDNKDTTISIAVKAKNSGLSDANLSITAITSTTATVSATGYQGTVNVKFTIKAAPTLPKLSDSLKTTDIGEIADKTNKTIIAAVQAKNTDLSKVTTLAVADITDTTATISSTDYTGTVGVKYTIKAASSK